MKHSTDLLIDDDVKIVGSTLRSRIWIRIGSLISKSIIGNDVFIGFRCTIKNSSISNNVQIASKTKIGGDNKTTTIEKFVWIGADAIISEGVTIGEGSIIGANSIINQDVEPYTIIFGQKKKTIKQRNYTKDREPEFSQFLKTMIKSKEQNKYIQKNKFNNYISASIEKNYFSSIGENNIFIGSKLANGGLVLGRNITVGNNTILEAAGKIYIDENSTLENNIHILSTSHDYKNLSLPTTMQPVKIGRNVTIGSNTIILGGITISDNSIIPSNSFILKNISR
ncbi:acyltransferase [Carnobacterium divergens]|uniref:acyltransferase n=1 Tax=Carnobacterium divergens TaxID=2748 RepID=UPI0007F39841|nr:DapH/DapD/GlmU-related protein [Carnobacterium divergens]SBO17644.1 conserved hypothetical protein [Carnobacterium divergens]